MRAAPADVLIVGAGPAGCVLAHRLVLAGRRVTLLEAGPDYGPNETAWPDDLRDPTSVWTESHPWGHVNATSVDADVAAIGLPRARVVGGTTTVNGCIWLRGSAADYDDWAARGNPGWSFADLLPFARMAEADPLPGELHGGQGMVPVFRAGEASLSPVDQALVESALALGLPYVDDFNAAADQAPGVGPTPKNVRSGVRMNAAFTYLAAVRDHPNLTLAPDSAVDRVVTENGRAIGVRLSSGEELAAGQIILCAGAYGSPAILLRSGIGPADHLTELGIPIAHELAGVGGNLRDHPLVMGLAEATIDPAQAPATRSFMPVMIKARSRQAHDEIDVHIYEGQSYDAETREWRLWLSVSLQHARSAGMVRLSSADPAAPLAIDHRYLSDPGDLEALCDGVELAHRLLRTGPLAEACTLLPDRSLTWTDRDELRAKVRRRVGTTFHPSSTCAMGPADDPAAVVDAEGRVHGIEGLRIVDGSIFPTGPRCNLHFPIVIAAERIAAGMTN